MRDPNSYALWEGGDLDGQSTGRIRPKYHAAKIQRMLTEVIEHLRADIDKVSEPKAQALFETGAEVLLGLRTAFEHYEKGAEPAMRDA